MATDVAVSLNSSNDFETTNADFREALRQEEQDLEDDADGLSFYPVVILGLSYTF